MIIIVDILSQVKVPPCDNCQLLVLAELYFVNFDSGSGCDLGPELLGDTNN